MDPNFEDWDSCYENEPTCLYSEPCPIADAQDELAMEQRHKLWFHLKRWFSKKYRERLDDMYMWMGLAGTEHCQFSCPFKSMWMGPEKED
ncbi:MAG: hypothetical protein Q6370_012335 [Candidatus Sigynarchaeota archaeon]